VDSRTGDTRYSLFPPPLRAHFSSWPTYDTCASLPTARVCLPALAATRTLLPHRGATWTAHLRYRWLIPPPHRTVRMPCPLHGIRTGCGSTGLRAPHNTCGDDLKLPACRTCLVAPHRATGGTALISLSIPPVTATCLFRTNVTCRVCVTAFIATTRVYPRVLSARTCSTLPAFVYRAIMGGKPPPAYLELT